jgi:hypothetical protein
MVHDGKLHILGFVMTSEGLKLHYEERWGRFSSDFFQPLLSSYQRKMPIIWSFNAVL